MTYEIRYMAGGREKLVCFSDREETPELLAEATAESGVHRLILTPKTPVALVSVKAATDFDFRPSDVVMLNGYQSWTDSHEHTIREREGNLDSRMPKFVQKAFAMRAYGDYDFAEYSSSLGEFHGWTYGYIRRGENFTMYASLNERPGFTEVRIFPPKRYVQLRRDCEGLVIREPYEALHFAILKGKEQEIFDKWFSLMGIEPPKTKPITGYTSWYNFYQDISEEKILQNLAAVEKSPMDFDVFQIDDGYQTAVGDWLSIKKKTFPNGLKPISDRVKADGMIPGLWMAPFSAQRGSKLAKQHPDWLLRGDDGKPLLCGANWGGFYALDLYNAEARDYVKTCLQTAVREWGFELLKLDFLYCVCLRPTAERTRGMIMFDAMDFIRECVPEAKILGCGVPLAAAFGKVEYCRIGCDVGLDLDDKPHMRLIHRERVSTKNSLRNTVFRRQLNGRAFWNDPDVFLLRDDNIELTWEQRETLARLNAMFGGVKFTSDDVSGYKERQQAVLKQVLAAKYPAKTTVTAFGKQYKVEVDGETFYI